MATTRTTKLADWQVKFDQFWLKWPARITASGRVVKLNVVAAGTWFQVHKPDDALFAQIMAGVEGYAAVTDPRYIQDAFRWLGKKRWQDEYNLPKQGTGATVVRCFRCGKERTRDRPMEMKSWTEVKMGQSYGYAGWQCTGGCK